MFSGLGDGQLVVQLREGQERVFFVHLAAEGSEVEVEADDGSHNALLKA